MILQAICSIFLCSSLIVYGYQKYLSKTQVDINKLGHLHIKNYSKSDESQIINLCIIICIFYKLRIETQFVKMLYKYICNPFTGSVYERRFFIYILSGCGLVEIDKFDRKEILDKISKKYTHLNNMLSKPVNHSGRTSSYVDLCVISLLQAKSEWKQSL